jgi:hypothetical protein
MRPALAFLLVLCSRNPTAANAQGHAVDRGVWQLGGSAYVTGYSDSRVGDDGVVLGLTPFAGYFIIPGLAVTGNLWASYTSTDDYHVSTIGLGPGLTYYFDHHPKRLHPLVSARFSWARTRIDRDQGSSPSSDTYRWAATGGAVYLLARNVGLTGEVFYSHTYFTTDIFGADKNTGREEYGTQFGIAVFLY